MPRALLTGMHVVSAADLAAPVAPASFARMARMDHLCALAVLAAEGALVDAGRRGPDAPRPLAALLPERVAVVAGTRFGCHATNADYYRGLLADPDLGASPRLFAYTLPSSPLGEVCIHLGAKGPARALASGRHAGVEALCEAAALCAAGLADVAVVVAVETGGGVLAELGLSCEDGAVALVVEPVSTTSEQPDWARAVLLGAGCAYFDGAPTAAGVAARERAFADAGLPLSPTRTMPPAEGAGGDDGAMGALAALPAWLRRAPAGERGLLLATDENGAAAAWLVQAGSRHG